MVKKRGKKNKIVPNHERTIMICAECNRGEVFNFGVGRLKCCNCDTIYNKYDYQFDINQIMQENRAKTQELLNTICRLQQENSRLSTELIILKSK